MEEEHTLYETHDATVEDGSLPLEEYWCPAEGHTTIVRRGSNYCPMCGDEL